MGGLSDKPRGNSSKSPQTKGGKSPNIKPPPEEAIPIVDQIKDDTGRYI